MKKQLVLAALLASAPFVASAEGLSYSYVEGGYTRVNADTGISGFDPELDGGYIRGSAELGENFTIFGGYSKTQDDVRFSGFSFDTDFETAEIGFGYHADISDRADFIAELSYLRQEIDIDGISGEAKGGKLNLGIRGEMTDNLEGWVKAGYVDGGDFEGDFVGTLGGQYKFNQTWGIVGEVEFNDETTQYMIGARASF
ncbi:outer membrane beta-barrel protein [Lysobacter sp. 5GHs7-4]|uniref:outer membrane beta-barrel protein n=1 Tax=Lysobacter sp. 5GHs7-4 TaxID=2904253 RepID=UPI001E4D688E|nr:outer membrane beta-barrel protein [Lysobacter sp. 5GHs7-4]UHQ23591.1 outer membrane beta-barrel protein [Lysobacter sp. 5GHs7-4]